MSGTPDLIILGSGSSAFAAALRATSLGGRVVMFEKSVLGGTCINWGCVPSKTLIHASLFNHQAHLGMAIGLGLMDTPAGVNFEQLSVHRDQVVQKLRQERYLDLLKNMPGLELVKETARFIDSHTVETLEKHYRCDKFLVAVGGVPRIPAIPGIETCNYLTSRSALLIRQLPRSMVIIGGGVIAVELGQMFHRLGCRVTILEHGPRILPTVEREPTEALQEALIAEGIEIVANVAVCSAQQVGEISVVQANVGDRSHEYTAERLLLAVGTDPAVAGLGLEKAGVRQDARGFIETDAHMRTSQPGIWAAGDVTGHMLIATVGAREAIVAVDDMFNQACGCSIDYLSAPMAVFTDPEVGIIGHSEESARQAGFDVIVNTMPVSSIPKAQITGHTAGAIKMVAERGTGRLLGVHLACHRGAEMINEAALALQLKATVQDLAATMHVYPSIGEGLKLCAQGFSRDISKLSCCAE
jgi:mercuric reductase